MLLSTGTWKVFITDEAVSLKWTGRPTGTAISLTVAMPSPG